MTHLSLLRFDAQVSPETRTYFDCFCVVTNGIGVSPFHCYYFTCQPLISQGVFFPCRVMSCELYLYCIVQSDPSGNKLKELIMEKGITSSIVNYLQTKVPAKL